MTVPEILKELEPYTGRFPMKAMRAAVEQRLPNPDMEGRGMGQGMGEPRDQVFDEERSPEQEYKNCQDTAQPQQADQNATSPVGHVHGPISPAARAEGLCSCSSPGPQVEPDR